MKNTTRNGQMERNRKMKRFFVGAMMLALVTGACGAAELRIATVDLDKVFTAHPKTQSAEADLKLAEEAIQAEMEQMVAEGRALEDEVTQLREAAKSPMLTESARLKKRNEAEDKLTELQAFQLRARRMQETKLKQMREQVMKSRQSIVDEMTAAVADFAKEEGYDLVLDSSGMTMNAVPLMVFSKPEFDVTDKLIDRMKLLVAK